jgi:hypothetical protein
VSLEDWEAEVLSAPGAPERVAEMEAQLRAAKWVAPWTDEQIQLLLLWQTGGWIHPYTCGNDSNHPVLVPTENGWICSVCDYTQNWAHEMASELDEGPVTTVNFVPAEEDDGEISW